MGKTDVFLLLAGADPKSIAVLTNPAMSCEWLLLLAQAFNQD